MARTKGSRNAGYDEQRAALARKVATALQAATCGGRSVDRLPPRHTPAPTALCAHAGWQCVGAGCVIVPCDMQKSTRQQN